MSSELHELFRRELDQISLPPPGDWVPRDLLRATSPQLSLPRVRLPRFAFAALVTVVLVVASVTGAHVLTDLRDRLSPRTSPSPTDASGATATPTEFIYLADGDLNSTGERTPQAMGLLAVEMPKGTVVTRLAGQSYVGGRYAGRPIRIGADFAFVPILQDPSRGQVPGVRLRTLDLRRAVPLGLVDANFEPLTTTRTAEPLLTGPWHQDIAVSSDQRNVFFVRDAGTDGHVTVVTRFSAGLRPPCEIFSPQCGPQRTAERRWSTETESFLWSRLVPLDGSRVAVVQNFISGSYFVQQDWHFLDEDLNEIALFRVDSHFGFSASACGLNLTRVAATQEWLMVCSDPGGFGDSILVFFDDALRRVAQVALSRDLGFVLGASYTPDGLVAALTQRAVVVRIDPQTHAIRDKRLVAGPASLVHPGLSLAYGLDPRGIQFSPDGGYAFTEVPWGGISRIDLAGASLTAYSPVGPFGRGLFLTADGQRLYVLVLDDDQRRRILVLDAASLQVLSRSDLLPANPSPFAIVTGATKR